MILSMTGYGRAVGTFDNKKITVETRSLNSKQADINIKLPHLYKEKELIIRNRIISALGRGKIELSVFVESDGSEKKSQLNKELIASYYKELSGINAELKNHEEDILSIVMRMPDVLKTERPELSDEEWIAVEALIEMALTNQVDFRKDEGDSLSNDLNQRVSNISNLLSEVEPFEAERIETVKARIQKNLEENLNKDQFDESRFEQELIFYLEKYDISEEKVRLSAHCKYFLETMGGDTSQGKKLGFISQEMGREINTLGSKANHAEIQRKVVQMKDELEKIKEQVLNVL